MSERGDILSRIHHLERKIEEYRNKIAKLEEKRDYLKERKDKVNKDFYEPEKAFDMTVSETFRGNLESDAEDLRKDIVSKIEIAQKELAEFLNAIQRAIEKLYELIEECEREIDSLEDELSALSEVDSNGVM